MYYRWEDTLLELRNLQTFQKIAQLQSFSKAAQELGYTQSAVTMQMKQLESELHTTLFDHIGRKIALNQNGMQLLEYTDSILNEVNDMKNSFLSNDGPSGELRIGILESICTACLPKILAVYHEAYPTVTTVIKMGTFAELSELLQNGSLDLIWIYDHLVQSPQWHCAFSFASDLEIVCASTHTLAAQQRVTLSTIAEENLILTEKSCSYRNEFITSLITAGFEPNIFLEIGSTEIIKKFVSENLGIAVLPRYTIQDELDTNMLSLLHVEGFKHTMYGQILYHKNKWISPAMNEFINEVRNFITY